jgi:AraC-like DNA-binding protein
MERAPSYEAYLSAPEGRWIHGEGWLHFCTADPYLCGNVMWGPVVASGLEMMLACASASMNKLPEHAALIDGRRVRSIDAVCYAMTSDFVIRNRKRLADRVTSLAGVRPFGFVGALAEGFWRMLPPPYPVSLFGERGEALRWLGCEEQTTDLDEIERIANLAMTSASVLGDLHRVLEQEVHEAAIESSARLLGMSVRSLQRRLRSERTTFQRELSVVRVRLAQRLMLETDATLSRIAADAGFASPAAFSVVFRKHAGQSPSEWRVRRLRGSVP